VSSPAALARRGARPLPTVTAAATPPNAHRREMRVILIFSPHAVGALFNL
jgi:hypothetical protein